jgi:hypothetical protein
MTTGVDQGAFQVSSENIRRQRVRPPLSRLGVNPVSLTALAGQLLVLGVTLTVLQRAHVTVEPFSATRRPLRSRADASMTRLSKDAGVTMMEYALILIVIGLAVTLMLRVWPLRAPMVGLLPATGMNVPLPSVYQEQRS